jgi:hypothetical protein
MANDYWLATLGGAFGLSGSSGIALHTGEGTFPLGDFQASRVVKTGPQVQPVHFSVRLWRRIS